MHVLSSISSGYLAFKKMRCTHESISVEQVHRDDSSSFFHKGKSGLCWHNWVIKHRFECLGSAPSFIYMKPGAGPRRFNRVVFFSGQSRRSPHCGGDRRALLLRPVRQLVTALGVTNLEVLMGTRFVRRVVLRLLRKFQLALFAFEVRVDPALTDLQRQVRGRTL